MLTVSFAMNLQLVLSIVLGAIIGSFSNVVSLRLSHTTETLPKDLLTTSQCASCRQKIRAFDNIPVLSWLLLRGRCRNCGARISCRYFIIEVLCAVLSGFLTWMCGYTRYLFVALLVFWFFYIVFGLVFTKYFLARTQKMAA
jgi:leader peptidase (prepilin peptidase)/N-methyltransferase